MIIDFHTHFYPEKYLTELRKGEGYAKAIQEGNRTVIRYTGDYNIVVKEYIDIEERLRDMDRMGLDMQVLTSTSPGVEREEASRGVQLARIINDGLAEIVEAYPGRFTALGVLPLQDPEEAVIELVRLVKECSLPGVCIPSNVAGKPLDSPEFSPVFEKAEKLGVFVHIHPTSPLNTVDMTDNRLVTLLGYCVDTSLAVLRLMFSGLLDRLPDLELGASHLGGVYPFLLGRLDQGYSKYPEVSELKRPPSEYLRGVYVDSCGYNSRVIRYVVDCLGYERVLMGSDYPAQIGDDDPVKRIRAVGLSSEEELGVLGLNAAKLLGI